MAVTLMMIHGDDDDHAAAKSDEGADADDTNEYELEGKSDNKH